MGIIIGAGAIGLGIFLTPILLGFGKIGIAAGSIAAFIQSLIGVVKAGSLFSFFQSLGMTGSLILGSVISGFTMFIGIASKFFVCPLF